MKKALIFLAVLISLDIKPLPAFWDLIMYPKTKKENTLLVEDVLDCLLTQEQLKDYELERDKINSWGDVVWKLKNKYKSEKVCFNKFNKTDNSHLEIDLAEMILVDIKKTYQEEHDGFYEVKPSMVKVGFHDCLFFFDFIPKEERFGKPFTHVGRVLAHGDSLYEIRIEGEQMVQADKDLWLGIIENHEIFNRLSIENKRIASQ